MSGTLPSLKDVTIGIKTFERYDRLKALLSSLQLDVEEIIVADDSHEDVYITYGKETYEKFSKFIPLRVLRLPYDSGLAYGRNRIYERVNTPYLLLLDDDMVIPGVSLIQFMKDIIEHDRSLCGLSACLFENGRIRTGGHFLIERKGYLIRDVYPKIDIKIYKGIPYVYVDHAFNAMILRVECLDDYRWDERFKIEYEHLDFHWGHKQLGKWKFALTTSVILYHFPGGSEKYNRFRFNKGRKSQSKKYFLRKWHINGVISIQTDLLISYTNSMSAIWIGIKKSAPFLILRAMSRMEEYLG
ncbi:MAG: glycosyltransferase [Candidatus Korarchaeota archaeon]